MNRKYTIALGLLLLGTLCAAQDETNNANEETEAKGKPMKVAGLDMEVNKRLGSAMFTMFAGNNTENSLSFGLAKILEVTADGTEITEDKHVCKFDKELKDNVEVLCQDGDETKGQYAGLDENGNKTNIPYVMSVKTCPLSSCQDAAATIKIKSYIFTSGGYICQPDCEQGEGKTMLQSPVFNGTAKWDVEIEGWKFCETCGANNDVAAEKLKIFFAIAAKRKGKSALARKNKGQQFDWKKCEIDAGISKKEDFEESVTKRQADDKKPDGGSKKPDGAGGDQSQDKGKGKDRRPSKMSGKCKPARGTSFKGKPEDQESFRFADSDGGNATMTFRMYPMAKIDGTEVIEADKGFEGPNVTEVQEAMTGSGDTQPRKYVVITVKKFSTKLVYDPTGDMSESGGTTTPVPSSSTALGISFYIVSMLIVLIINML